MRTSRLSPNAGVDTSASAVVTASDDPVATPFRLAEVVTGVPRTVWVITAAFVCLCACYAFLLPTYRAPDEYAHVDLIYGLRTGDGLGVPMERFMTPEVYGTVAWLEFAADQPRPLPPEEARPRDERPSFQEVAPLVEERYNWLTNHPPLYYLLGAGVLFVPPGVLDWNFDQVVAWLRLANVVLTAPLPLLIFAVARRVTSVRAVAVAAAALPLAVPQLTHLSGSVNNDNLVNVVGALVVLVAVAVAGGDLSRRTSLWAGGAVGVALLTKAFGVVFLPFLGLAYLIGWARRRGPLPWQPVVVAFATAFVVGGWWWVRNLIVFGTAQPVGAPPRIAAEGPRASGAAFWIDMFWHWFVERLWGSFGWLDTPIPWRVAAVGVALVLLGIGLAVVLPRRRGGRRVDILFLMVPSTLLLGLVVFAVWEHYVRTGVPAGIQGRYLYAGLAGVAVAAAVGYGKLLRGGARALPLLVFAGAVVMHWIAVRTILGHYWNELRGPVGEALRAVIAWSPWDGVWLVAGWAASACVVAILALSMISDVLWPSAASEDRPRDAAPATGSRGGRAAGGAHRRS